MGLLDKVSLLLTPNAVKESKLYSIIPSNGTGDLTATRNTTATRVNSLGLIELVALNVPRIDYANSTFPFVLIEPQRTNLLTNSNNFTNVSWVKDNLSVTSNTVLSPDGTLSASTVNEGGGTGSHYLYSTSVTNFILGSKYTETVFAKKNQDDWIQLTFSANSFGADTWANFNLSNGQIGNKGSAAVANIVALNNGYYRISLTGTATINGSSATCFIAPTNNVNTGIRIGSFQGTNRNNFHIYGAQLEQGSYETSYIPTVASAVTRNKDLISKTGISDLIGQTEGIFYMEISSLFNTLLQRQISLTDGTQNNRVSIDINNSSNIVQATLVSGGSVQVALTASITQNTFFKVAVRYQLNNTSLFFNGVKISTDNTCLMPIALNQITFDRGDAAEIFEGKVKGLQLYNTLLTDAECVSLTTL